MRHLSRILLAAIGLAMLAGCATDPRYGLGLQWVEEQEMERRTLQAQGFPQYTWY